MRRLPGLLGLCLWVCSFAANAGEPASPAAFINGEGPGWVALTLADFQNVNCDENTWSEADGVIHCTGQPIGVTRSLKQYTNLELVLEWRHLEPGGNSGVFLWAPDKVFEGLKRNQLPPGGIEVQILDPEYITQFEQKTGKSAEGMFTGHGDVFSVGSSTIEPFPPMNANQTRSFPIAERVKPVGEWNHYYVRAINGEVRLWVNGQEVSGGRKAVPAKGWMCLESEGAPVEFRHLKIRELP